MKFIKLFEAFKFELVYGGMFSKYVSNSFTLMGGQRVQGGLNINGVNYYRLRYTIYSHEILQEVDNQEEAVIGTIDLGRTDDGTPVGLLDLKFKPKFRGRGFGKLLVKELVESTKDGLTVLDIQKKALKFWEKMGAKIEKTKYSSLTGFIPKQ
jgi:GNAT superfamily N-acetyltransferase